MQPLRLVHELVVTETMSYRVSATAGAVELAGFRRSAASLDPGDWVEVLRIRLTVAEAKELRSALSLAAHSSEIDE
ncbi:MAG: hypothetical protein IT352_15775 [Gemmatimonadales bacterium]|nr:hypothetical protein [Gemmatimonadales bacterium]